MSDDDRSYRDAELQYQKQRVAELAAELDVHLRELSAAVDTEITRDSVKPMIAIETQRLIETLRQRGHSSLAQQYDATLSEWKRREEQFVALVATLHAQPTFTAEDRARIDAARAASDEALEQYERVAAQVDAWLDAQERNE